MSKICTHLPQTFEFFERSELTVELIINNLIVAIVIFWDVVLIVDIQSSDHLQRLVIPLCRAFAVRSHHFVCVLTQCPTSLINCLLWCQSCLLIDLLCFTDNLRFGNFRSTDRLASFLCYTTYCTLGVILLWMKCLEPISFFLPCLILSHDC